MSINSLIIDTLTPLEIPVDFQTYDGDEETYITFFFYNESGALFADDDEQSTIYYTQIDVWGPYNLEGIVKQAKSLLKQAGFNKRFIGDGPFLEEKGIYHKIMRFSITTTL
jgi:hypothetical protein